MHTKSFDDRIEQIRWQPGPVPTRRMIDDVLGSSVPVRPRSALLTFLGAVLGILIGVGLKSMVLAGFTLETAGSWAGTATGAFVLSGFAGSAVLAICAAFRGGRSPGLMQFSSINLLMIAVLLLS